MARPGMKHNFRLLSPLSSQMWGAVLWRWWPSMSLVEVKKISLGGSSRPVSEGHRDQSQRLIKTRKSAESLIVSPGGGSVNVSGAARPRWQEKWLPRRGTTTAGTELMWLIDPKSTNQKETQYSYPHKIGDIGVSPWASNKISFCWVWSV